MKRGGLFFFGLLWGFDEERGWKEKDCREIAYIGLEGGE